MASFRQAFDKARQDKACAHILGLFIALQIIFFAHRLLSFPYLSRGELFGWPAMLKALATGYLSDAWVAMLLSLIFGLATAWWSAKWRCYGAVASTALAAFLMGLHQSYVEFFGYQMLLFHFSYFLDPLFLQANSSSLLVNPRVWLTWGVGVAMGTCLIAKNPWRRLSRRQQIVILIGLALITLAGHSTNIHYRVQLILPENLRMNVVERLFEAFGEKALPDALTLDEQSYLAQSLGRPWPPVEAGDEKATLSALLLNPVEAPMGGPVVHWQHLWQQKVAAGKKPLLLVILMESLRASDTGFLSTQDGKLSLTPHLDALAKNSYVFTQAYSTGNVTRGGQEAVWCGYLSSQSTSMMRKRPNLAVDCLPRLAQHAAAGTKGMSFWHHGGQGAFDGQRVFWHQQGVLNFLEEQSFAANTARTGWGVGDRSFFQRAAKELSDLHHSSDAAFSLGMALSVSNHPPWTMPRDRSDTIARVTANLPRASYGTVAYSDEALHEYLAALRQYGLWDEALIVITGDHGHQDFPGYHPVEEGRQEPRGALLTHVPLLVTGGFVDHWRASLPPGQWDQEHRHHEVVSQADVAPFLAQVLGASSSWHYYGQPLWSQRLPPVVTNVGDRVYFPALDRAYTLHELLDTPVLNTDPAQARAILYYRAFLRLISF